MYVKSVVSTPPCCIGLNTPFMYSAPVYGVCLLIAPGVTGVGGEILFPF